MQVKALVSKVSSTYNMIQIKAVILLLRFQFIFHFRSQCDSESGVDHLPFCFIGNNSL